VATDYPPAAGVTWAGPPASYGVGRSGHTVKFSIVHTTEGHEGFTAAEDGIAYDKTRDDGISTHCFHDADSSPQEVLRRDTAYAAFEEGNNAGIQHELCGTAGQGAAGWADAVSQATIRRAAMAVADDCLTYHLQPRRLSIQEIRDAYYQNGPGGICGHVDITNAFPGPGRDHTDPGPTFPWDQFIGLVRQFMAAATAGGEVETMRFTFNGLANTPTGVEGRVHVTDGLRYRVYGLSGQVDALLSAAGAGPIVAVGPAQLPTGWDYPRAVSQLCGTQDPGELAGDGTATLVAHTHDGGTTGPAVAA
jgi:hypothetical protein